MITLYTFGPYFDLPDGSPFVIKAMLLLKFAGLAYQEDRKGYKKAPKGKLPYINDAGVIVADSTFIRFHIEEKYGFDFDAGLTPEQRAVGWAAEKMCEDHLHWALMASRWIDDANFAKGPAHFFDAIPFPVRPIARSLVRRKVIKGLDFQGMSRHSEVEALRLAKHDIDALAILLGNKPYFSGDTPCAADAAVFASVASLATPFFETPLVAAVNSHANLIGYRDRVLQRYFQA